MLASVVPFTSIATFPLALIVPEFEIVKSERSSAKILTVFDVIVEPESTVTLTLLPVTFAGLVAPVFKVELFVTVKNSPFPSISCWLVVVPPLFSVALSAKTIWDKNKQLKKNKINFEYILDNLFKIKLISILKKQIKPTKMAERKGFEPLKRLPVYTLSKRAPSATRPPLLLART